MIAILGVDEGCLSEPGSLQIEILSCLQKHERKEQEPDAVYRFVDIPARIPQNHAVLP